MAFFERLQARDPGMARQPEVPGGPPLASKPADKVNPPAAAARPVGRPQLPPPTFPGGPGRALPLDKSVEAAAPTSAARPAPGPSQAPKPPPTAAQPARQPAPSIGATAPAAIAPPLQQMFDRVPTLQEIANVPQGTGIQTPYGTMERDGRLNLSPEGEIKYKQALVQRRKQFGPHPFAADPNAPKPDVRLNGRFFNPFSGLWGGSK